MEYKWDNSFKFGSLNTYFEVHVAGMEGECFDYSIYFEDGADEEKVKEVSKAINEWASQYDEDDYLGYIDAKLDEEKVFVYLDLGSIEDCDRSIYGIVEALKNVKGIKSVIVNESLAGLDDFDYDMDDM